MRSPICRAERFAIRRIGLALALVLLLAGCEDEHFDPQSQIGANPALPEPRESLMPSMNIAKPIGWVEGEKPKVASGLKVQALARDLKNPRNVYVLPNGDVLAVESSGPSGEPVTRPKDLIMGWIMSFAHGNTKGGNRITLLRDADGDGVAELRTVFLDHLKSPFGVVLVGQDIYVANTDAIMRYEYTAGQTAITEPGTKLIDLPGGPINHHWTKSLAASPDGSRLYVGVGRTATSSRTGLRPRKDGRLSGRSIALPDELGCSRAGCATRTA